jgi:hypothetical protein
MPLLLKNILITNSAPAEEFHSVSPFLLFDLGSRGEHGCPNSFMAAVWPNYSEPHLYVETDIVNYLFRLFVNSPRIGSHDFTRIGNSHVVSRSISSVFYSQLELVRLWITDLCDYIGPIRVNGALFSVGNALLGERALRFDCAQLLLHNPGLLFSRSCLIRQVHLLFVDGVKLPLHGLNDFFVLLAHTSRFNQSVSCRSRLICCADSLTSQCFALIPNNFESVPHFFYLLFGAGRLFFNMQKRETCKEGVNSGYKNIDRGGPKQSASSVGYNPTLSRLVFSKRIVFGVAFLTVGFACCFGGVVDWEPGQ